MNDNEFVEFTKNYLRRISGGGASYVYLNIADRTVMLTNSTTKRSLLGDRLMSFAIGYLSMHLMHIKNEAYWERFQSFLHLDTYEGVVMLYANNLVTFLNKSVKQLSKMTCIQMGDEIWCGPIGAKTTRNSTLIGAVVTNHHVAREVLRWTKDISAIRMDADTPHIVGDLSLDRPDGKLSYFKVDLHRFTYRDNSPVFTGYHRMSKFLMVDGLTAPCYAFIANYKKSNIAHSMKYCLWAKDGTHIHMLTTFEDENVSVRTYRPHAYILATPLDFPRDAVTI